MTGESTPGGDKDSLGPAETTTAVSEPVASADRSRETEEETRDSGDSGDSGDSEEAKRASAEEFGRQHDPAKHDIAAGEESRQRGDWTADEPDGRVWDAEGNLVEATSIGQPADGEEESGDHGAAALDRAGRVAVRPLWTRSATAVTASGRRPPSTMAPCPLGTPSRRGSPPRPSSSRATPATTRVTLTSGSRIQERPDVLASSPPPNGTWDRGILRQYPRV